MTVSSVGVPPSSVVVLRQSSLDEEQDLRVREAASSALIPRETSETSVYLSQFDSLVGPMMRKFVSGDHANRKLMHFQPNARQRFHLTGLEIGSVLHQLREAIPGIACVPAHRRRNLPIEVVMPTGDKVSVVSGDIPEYLAEMQKLLHPPLNHFICGADELVEVSKAQVQEVSIQEKSAKERLVAELSSWIFDPGNPEKGKKYIYSLYCTRNVLDEKFPRWKSLFLPQLRELATHSAFAKHAYFALNALKDNAQSEVEIRAQYAYILSNIREAYGHIRSVRFDTPELKQTLQMLLQFCHSKFTQVYMYPFLDGFIPEVLRANGNYEMPKFSWKNLADDIQDGNDRLAQAPPEFRQTLVVKEFKKLRGALGWGFDPVGDSNTPWVHSIQETMTKQGPHRCTVLRHGTPTCDPGLLGTVTRIFQNAIWYTPSQQAAVIAEYKAYLAAEPEKVTLYVNHQEYDGKGRCWVTAERDRTRAIRSLEADFPNFNFLALPMDGPLWEDAYLEKVSIQGLKRDLFNSLVEEAEGFAFPRGLIKREECQAKIGQLLDSVHDLYFEGDELTPDMKKTFIMLFYSELKDYLKARLKVDYIASVCKDHKERGNVSTTIDMVKNLVKLGFENDPERLREVFISVLGPFIIKNEHIFPARLQIALNAIRHLSKLTEAQKERIRKRSISGYEIRLQTVPREETSWSQMVGRKKFFIFVEEMRKRGEKRVVLDKDFQANLASSFLKNNGCWDLEELKKQIIKDMPRCEISLNRVRMLDFSDVCRELRLDPAVFDTKPKDEELSAEQRRALRFLSMLQQSASEAVMRDASKYLNGNLADYVVSDTVLAPLRKMVHEVIGRARVDAEGALEFAKKTIQEHPAFADYLSSAVAFGFLPKIFTPDLDPGPPYKPVYSTRIIGGYDFRSGKRELIIEQELTLRHPEGERAGPIYSIESVSSIQNDEPAKLSWNFTRPS